MPQLDGLAALVFGRNFVVYGFPALIFFIGTTSRAISVARVTKDEQVNHDLRRRTAIGIFEFGSELCILALVVIWNTLVCLYYQNPRLFAQVALRWTFMHGGFLCLCYFSSMISTYLRERPLMKMFVSDLIGCLSLIGSLYITTRILFG